MQPSVDTIEICVFQEHSDDTHVLARERLMAEEHSFPREQIVAANDVAQAIDWAQVALKATGAAFLQLEEPFNDKSFLCFSQALGEPEQEHDPVALPHTTEGVILSLTTLHGHAADVSDQPFSTDYLRLHTESSRRAAHRQPRYIVLMCLEPGGEETRAQTLLVPMVDVAARLDADTLTVLKRIRYANSPDAPPILRDGPYGPIFSFRDFGEDALAWKSADPEEHVDAETGNAALRALLAALHQGGDWSGVTWQRGLLVVIDNFRYFHGRSLAGVKPTGTRRVLKRIRILDHT